MFAGRSLLVVVSLVCIFLYLVFIFVTRTVILTDLSLFTASELAYVKYGEGEDKLVDSRDPRYLHFIRSQLVTPSAGKPVEIPNLDQIKSNDFVEEVDKLLKHREHRFFVECGAHDGVFLSNTLFLETHRGWSGLLIEANDRLFRKILTLNRKASVFGGCLSPTNRPGQLMFKSANGGGGLVNHLTSSSENFITQYKLFEAINPVQCFPLSDILAALGVNRVDFLSLDVQGAELAILRTIDHNKLRIETLVLEVFDESATLRRILMTQLHDYMNGTGVYRLVRKFEYDMMFKRIDVR